MKLRIYLFAVFLNLLLNLVPNRWKRGSGHAVFTPITVSEVGTLLLTFSLGVPLDFNERSNET